MIAARIARRKIKIGLPHIGILSIVKRNNHVQKGSMNNVKAILIEKTSGKGRTGKLYIFLPTKIKSK
jgi:hypothetical protein